MGERRIYLDHAATTPLDPRAFTAMKPFLLDVFGNPSTLYLSGRKARRAMDEARDAVAEVLGARSPREIVFTGSGSEADNMAVKGAALARRDAGRHLVASAIEHQAVLEALEALKPFDFHVTLVQPDHDGIVSAEAVAAALRPDTILVSVMHANNETGAVQPVAEIGAMLADTDVLFHTDAVQTVGHLPVDVEEIRCDLLTLSAHKFYGPKGAGALYVRTDTPLVPLMHGGGQEQEKRAGTENVAAIAGMSAALKHAVDVMEEDQIHLTHLRDVLQSALLSIEGCRLNGHLEHRLASHVNVSFERVDGESILLNLDMAGIEASSGSACTSGSIEPSHVLQAMGQTRIEAAGSVRFTLGRDTTRTEIDTVSAAMPQIIDRLRRSD